MITLVLGGVRSGKSEYAEQLAAKTADAHGAPVVYVATGRHDLGDEAFAARIAAHQARRSPDWRTVEAGHDLAAQLASLDGVALVDSLTTWLAAHDDFRCDTDALVDALAHRAYPTIVVSDEVGFGGIAGTAAGRDFADALGTLNQRVGAIASAAVLVVAGRALPLAQP